MHVAFSSKLAKEVQKVGTWESAEHLIFKQKDREITDLQIQETIKVGEITEYNDLKGTRRVLLKGSNNICVVVDLDTKCIVTAFHDYPRRISANEYLLGL